MITGSRLFIERVAVPEATLTQRPPHSSRRREIHSELRSRKKKASPEAAVRRPEQRHKCVGDKAAGCQSKERAGENGNAQDSIFHSHRSFHLDSFAL